MDQRKNSEQWHSKLFRVVNSAVCFSLAYILFTYLFWFVTGLAGRPYNFDAFVYYYGVKFILNSHHWTTGKVSFVYMAGPLFCLALGFFCLILYHSFSKSKMLISVFLLWSFIIGTSLFVSQGLIAALGIYNYGSSYYHNLAVVFSWWRMPVWLAYVLNIPFAILFMYFAINYGRPFLLFSYSYSKVNKLSRRRTYFFETAMAPFVVGAFITSLLPLSRNLPSAVSMPIHFIYLGVIGTALLIAWYSLTYIEVLKNEITRFKSFQTPNVIFFFLLVAACTFVYVTFKGVYIS